MRDVRALACLTAILFLTFVNGCVSSAARDLAVAHERALLAFDGASVPDPEYLEPDKSPDPRDGQMRTADQKLAAWKRARIGLLTTARDLRVALGGEEPR